MRSRICITLVGAIGFGTAIVASGAQANTAHHGFPPDVAARYVAAIQSGSRPTDPAERSIWNQRQTRTVSAHEFPPDAPERLAADLRQSSRDLTDAAARYVWSSQHTSVSTPREFPADAGERYAAGTRIDTIRAPRAVDTSSGRADGFDWGDAGLGAVGLALLLALGSVLITVRHGRAPTART